MGFWGFGFGLKYHPGVGVGVWVWVFLWFVVFGFFFGLWVFLTALCVCDYLKAGFCSLRQNIFRQGYKHPS
jgi:hypothetical protein